jgi:hypothetical protein
MENANDGISGPDILRSAVAAQNRTIRTFIQKLLLPNPSRTFWLFEPKYTIQFIDILVFCARFPLAN